MGKVDAKEGSMLLLFFFLKREREMMMIVTKTGSFGKKGKAGRKQSEVK